MTHVFSVPLDPLPKWKDAKRGLEREMLVAALGQTGGNQAAAGRLMGLTKVAVMHAVRRHRINVRDYAESGGEA